jgi:subtilisin family serine protease
MRARKFGQLVTLLVIVAVTFVTVTPAVAAPKDTVRVWVSYQSNRKAEVFQALDKSKATFHYDFPELEAYVVTLPEAALNGIMRNPNVVDVEVDPERYPIEPFQSVTESLYADVLDATGQQIVPWGIDAVQARDIWDADRDAVTDEGAPNGSGVNVCIIDTGYYLGHEDLTDTQVTGMSQVDGEWYTDGAGHGSHVAGTISAMNNALGVVGVTPGTVNFYIVKIFDNSGAWTTASNLVSGIYECQANGADIISMSLGGVSSSRKEERAFDTLYSAGILSIASAGNEQQETPGAFSYPASYSSVVSVAAVDSNNVIGDFSLQNSQVEIAAPGVGILSTIPFLETNNLVVDGDAYNASHIEYSAYTTAGGTLVDGGLCLSSGSWAGDVVICQRGETTFYEKVMAVQNGGGVAAIIYNNVDEDILMTLGDGNSSVIPAVSLSKADGEYLVANKLGTFASVECTYTWPISNYEAWNGTSMAAPHVSGVAALLMSANPSWTNVEIREAMNATALDLGAAGRDVVYGYGLVQAADALAYLGGVLPTETPTPTEDPTSTPTPTPTPSPTPSPTPVGDLAVTFTSPVGGSTFGDRDKVTISVLVTMDSSPVAGATVTVVMTPVLGSAVTFSGLTGTNGIVSFSYRLNVRKTGTGDYLLDATASLNGDTAAAEQISFLVQ